MQKSGVVAQLLIVCSAILPFGQRLALAEGSRSLYPPSYPSEGYRANLDIQPTKKYTGKVRRRTFLYVYAKAGEYILMGSSNRSSGGDIRIYDPQDFGTPGDEAIPTTANFGCASDNSPAGSYGGSGRGIISTRAEELAGPNSADDSVTVPNGFAPCAYLAPITGLYGVEFSVATNGTFNPNGSISAIASSTSSVAAWDVTVRSDATSLSDINGRVFTYAWNGFTGNNGRPIYSTHYYVTGDGYRYAQDLRGLDPQGYALYANSFGFLDNGQPLLKDVRGNEDLVTTLPVGVTAQIAQYPSFFSDISPNGVNGTEVETVLAALGIPAEPKSPSVSRVSFTGLSGESATTPGVGGTFRFETADTLSYEIIISRDGMDFDPANPSNRVLTGIAATGSHTVIWDGKDNAGASFPARSERYRFRVYGRNGDIHFPIIDPENNPGMGPTVTRLNGAASPSTLVYYDDRGYRTASGILVGNLNGTLCDTGSPAGPSVPYSLLGVDSTMNYRDWEAGGNGQADCVPGAGWGDAKGVNLWTHFAIAAPDATFAIQEVSVDVSTAITAPVNVAAGSLVAGTFSFANNGNSTADGVTYAMSMPPGLGTVSFDNLPVGAAASYNNATGAVIVTGLPTRLAPGQSLASMTFSFNAPASGPVVVSTAIDTTGADNVPANNRANVRIGVGTTDVSAAINAPAVAAAGSTVSGTLVFENIGANAAEGVTYSATIGSAINHPLSITFTGLPDAVSATYDNSTGTVTLAGLPRTLVPGQLINIGFSYPAPRDGAVPINSGIATTSFDADPANNHATATVTVVTVDAPVSQETSPAVNGDQRAPQNPLILKAGRTSACCGRLVVLRVKGGSVKSGIRYKVRASGQVTCRLVTSSNRAFLKIYGPQGAGSCTVTATKKGNAIYSPVSSNEVTIRLR